MHVEFKVYWDSLYGFNFNMSSSKLLVCPLDQMSTKHHQSVLNEIIMS